MTGPEHFRQAEDLAAKAGEYLGQGDGQDSAAVWAAVAQVHATLALAAATVGGPTPAVKSLRAKAEAMSAAALAIQLRRCHRMAAATWHTGVTRRVDEAAASGGLA
jgi:hypothetical protein